MDFSVARPSDEVQLTQGVDDREASSCLLIKNFAKASTDCSPKDDDKTSI
jgi:hypothetical protein